MAASEFSTLRASIARSFQDDDYDLFSEDDLDDLINEAQRDYAERTKALRSESVISSKENIEQYNFPADYLEFIRMEDDDGGKIIPKGWEWLEETYGEKYRDATGDPIYLYSDLDGDGQFRFYPRPDPTIEDAGTVFDAHLFQRINCPVTGDVHGIHAHSGRTFVMDVTYIHVFTGTPDARNYTKSIAHGITLAGPVSMIVAEQSSVVSEDTLVWCEWGGSDIYKTTIEGEATSTFGTSTSTANMLPCINTEGAPYIYWNTGSAIAYSSISSWSALTLAAVQCEQAIEINLVSDSNSGKLLAACGPDGIYRITATGAAQVSTVNTSGIARIDSGLDTSGVYLSCLYNSEDRLAAYDTLDDTVSNYIASCTTALRSFLWASNNMLYWGRDDVEVSALQRVDLDGNTTPITGSGVAPVFYYSNSRILGRTTAIEGVLFLTYGNNDTTFEDIVRSTNNEVGAVVYIEGDSFESEAGAIYDIGDADNLIVFDGEVGAITQAFESATAYSLWYVRYPDTDLLQISDALALECYVLSRLWGMDSEVKSLTQAQLCWSQYMRRIAREQSRRAKGYLGSGLPRPVSYYF